MTENKELQIFSKLLQDGCNKERKREVECKYCQRVVMTYMRAPKCMICGHDMITVVKTAGV